MNKKELRKWAKSARKTLDISSISAKICDNIRNLEIYNDAKNVMIFYPLPDEINLLSLLDDKKNFYLPKVEGDKLTVCPYQKGDSLVLSELKVMEPETRPVDESVLNIIFTPALCVDKNFYRLGYGGGFYDRFINNGKWKIEDGKIKTKFIVVVPEELIVKDLPTEKNDVACDGIITQKKASFLRG